MTTKISQTVAAAEQDVHDALIAKYGASRIRGTVRKKNRVSYLVETHSKRHLNCRVHTAGGAVTLEIAPHFGRFWAAVIVAGLVLFVVPGLVAGFWAGARYWSTVKRLPRYMEDISRLAEYQAKMRVRRESGRDKCTEPAEGMAAGHAG